MMCTYIKPSHVPFKYLTISFVNYISVKLEKIKIKKIIPGEVGKLGSPYRGYFNEA